MLFDKDINRVKKLGKVKVFRCRVCQDPYIGEEPPSRCPFCGAPMMYFIPAEEWNQSEYYFEISDVSKTNLEAALILELSNTAFYLCAMNAALTNGDEYGYAKFKALKKVENEHADAIVKFLQIKEPSLKKIPCSKDFKQNTQEGWDRENRAIKAYAKFALEAPELQLRQFFNALVEIETDHLELHAENLKE
jgi:rubrerythrin